MNKRTRWYIGVLGVSFLVACGGDPSEECQTDIDCDDGNACTVDTCSPNATCVSENLVCDDGAFCNGIETCDTELGCQEGTPPDVDDGVSCTNDSCDEDSDTIVNEPDDSVCDNGLFCDGPETCDAVNDCQPGGIPIPDDGVSCTNDSCDEDNDVIVNEPDDSLCDNGLFCDGQETCDAVDDCQPGTPPVIDDGVACTDDSCDEDSDVVVNAVDNANCDNGMFCDGQETCDAVADCQPGTPPSIDDGVMCTDDSCDEANGVIVNTANDANCDNGLFCDGQETCSAMMDCQAGVPPVTDDGVACTDDVCDEVSDMVVNTANDANCDDGITCTGDTCDPAADCQYLSEDVYDNGMYNMADAFASNDWANDGVMDDFSFPGIGGATDFCTVEIAMINIGVPVTEFQEMRVRVYPVGPGGLSDLGDFGSATPVHDVTHTAAGGDLLITDTGNDFGLFDIVQYTAHASACIELGAGDFALHITFPDWTAGTGFWLTSPTTGGTSDCAHEWGTGTTSPYNACATGGPNYENLDFTLRNPQ